MTVVALPTAPPAPPIGRRLWNAVRLHVANPWPTLILPWFIFAAIFGLNLAIWQIISIAAGGTQNLDADAFDYNGGVTWVLFFLVAMAVQAMSLTFRFALGLGMTRRDYYVGTVAYLAGLAAMYAVGIAVLAQVERATDGWGLGGRFFAPWFLADLPAWQLWYLNAAVGLMLAMIGTVVATMWVRWKALGLYTFFGAFAVILVATGWSLTVSESWGSLGRYLTTHEPAAIVSWTLPVSLLCGLLGFAILRRATPRA
ncbi:hypothetical protein OEB99_13665 [Actinotalea sp. M2MS4P-6]|uniref:hypothetical protein n=1 Tax=Actinotalea sp. M2MS4P-6 TaxID=2983762 RepID=UPI0021E4645C|nr:hypothetical protein [Actinotalea sp. M2MS4P-6]MCV2395359.1 hypothetical protein [Actinotalea sp. M2MS4P-6]